MKRAGQPASLADTIHHLRVTFQDLEKNVSADEIHHIERIRQEPRDALYQFAKEAEAAGLDRKEATGFTRKEEKNVFDIKVGYQPDLQPQPHFNHVSLFSRIPRGFNTKQPKDLEELVNIVQEAADKRKTVKAVGTCYAFSDIAFTTGTVLQMNRYLHNVLEIDKSVLKDASNEHLQTLFKVEAGATQEWISESLWPSEHRDKTAGYRTLLNQTGYQGMSIAGTVGTGANGQGLSKPPLTNYVESMHVVTVDGDYQVKQYWIEPTNGITDHEKFEAEYGQRGWELIQDDDTFNSSTCHIGCIGIVYSYIIRVDPAYYLDEHRRIQTWEETKEQLPALFAANLLPRGKKDSTHSFQILMNPYPVLDLKTGSSEVMCTLSTYKWGEPPRKNERSSSWTTAPKDSEVLRKAGVFVAKHTPKLMPEFVNLGLLATTEKEPVSMPCPEALDVGAISSSKVIVTEVGIDASSVDNVIKATDALITLFQTILEDNPHQYDSSPFSIRFVPPSTGYLAPQYGRRSCMIRAPILLGTPGIIDTLAKFESCLRDNFNGRPHWGQLNNMNFARVKALYPDSYEKFIQNVQRLDPHGTFSNQFTQRCLA